MLHPGRLKSQEVQKGIRPMRKSGRTGVYLFLLVGSLAAAAGVALVVAQTSDVATDRQRGHKALLEGNEADAMRWYRQAADRGDAESQVGVGEIYEIGQRNPGEAARWYAKAALQGQATGQAYLGHLYLTGKGVPRDYPEAFRWLEKAAAQKQPNAEYNLGYMYEFGLGVPRDRTVAAGWSDRAAAQGDAEAKEAAHHLRIPGSVSFRTPEERDRYLFNMLGEHLQTIRETSDRIKADCEQRQRNGEPWLRC
jgi:TPR repeat protein